VLQRDALRSNFLTALALLWQAALAERANESHFSIRIADRGSAERSRSIDPLLAREVEPDGIVLFTRSGSRSAPSPKPSSGEAAAES
jgi:hypothetical protein